MSSVFESLNPESNGCFPHMIDHDLSFRIRNTMKHLVSLLKVTTESHYCYQIHSDTITPGRLPQLPGAPDVLAIPPHGIELQSKVLEHLTA